MLALIIIGGRVKIALLLQDGETREQAQPIADVDLKSVVLQYLN